MSPPAQPHVTSTDLLVLHGLRCLGFTTLERVAEATGLAEAEVESELIDLAVAGLVTREVGAFGGWGLTDAGKAADAERVAAELDAAGTRAVAAETYERFLVLNPELLELSSAWQLRASGGAVAVNDHADPAYDARVLDRFVDLDQRAEVACADLSAVMLRFRRYRTRLAGALARARSGSLDHLTDSTSSYHAIWFQLHEDLLVTLGISRW